MNEIFLFTAVILLFLIWLSLKQIAAKLAALSEYMRAPLIEINERLQSIEERLEDNNFLTDEERQHKAEQVG